MIANQNVLALNATVKEHMLQASAQEDSIAQVKATPRALVRFLMKKNAVPVNVFVLVRRIKSVLEDRLVG